MIDFAARFMPLMSEALHQAAVTGGDDSLPMAALSERLQSLAQAEQRLPCGAPSGSGTAEGVESCLAAARFAVYAWVDETLMGSAREDALNWSAYSLQSVYFQTFDGGRRFFDDLQSLLSRALLLSSVSDENIAAVSVANDEAGVVSALCSALQRAANLSPEVPERAALTVFARCLLYGFSGQYHQQPTLLAELRRAALPLSDTPQPNVLLEAETQQQENSGYASLQTLLYVLLPLLFTMGFTAWCAYLLVG